MKTISIIGFIFLFILFGCEKGTDNVNKEFAAEIVGFDMNCSTCIVSFPDDEMAITSLVGENPGNYYQVVNLNKGDFEIGQKLKLQIRKAGDTELNACITMYPSYNYLNLYALSYEKYTNLSFNDTVELSYKDCLYDFGTQSYICLDTVLEDSRCPTGGECVWAGEARARFKIEKYNSSPVFIDLLEGVKDTTVCGYKFSFIKLLPYPKYGIQTKPEEYKALIMLN